MTARWPFFNSLSLHTPAFMLVHYWKFIRQQPAKVGLFYLRIRIVPNLRMKNRSSLKNRIWYPWMKGSYEGIRNDGPVVRTYANRNSDSRISSWLESTN